MPSIQDLNAFKNAVNQLGNEPAVAESKGEVLEDIQPNEEGSPLMPELWASEEKREARQEEREAQKEEAESQANQPQNNELSNEPSAFDQIIMQDDELFQEESPEAPAAENKEEEAPTYTLPQEFGELLGGANPEPPITEEEPEAIDEGIPDFADSRVAEPTEQSVPQDIYQLLDTGFSELDSERLNAEILGDDEEEIAEALPQIEEPEEPEPDQTEVEQLANATQEQNERFAALSDLLTQENITIPESEAQGAEAPPIAVQPPRPAIETIQQLEKALAEHRSVDLLNISEEETKKESEYDELGFSISQDNVRDFLIRLGSYPIALKLAIEEEIGENELNEAAVENLVEMVIAAEHPRKVANYFFSQTGKRIPLPKGQRYRVQDQEALNLRFHRQFAHLGFPLLRRAFLGILLLAVLFWLPLYYIYRPIQAYIYYKKGHAEIYKDKFREAERYFTLATDGWPLLAFSIKGWPYQSWFLKYAQAYAARRDFSESIFKMRQTLLYYPEYQDAWFAYIHLLSREMGEYAQAEEALQQFAKQFGAGYALQMLRGQNYLRWGESSPRYYENAQEAFAIAYGIGSNDDMPLLYLLDYYIRTAPYSNEQLQKLVSYFLTAVPSELKVDPRPFARIMSQTADYYMARGRLEIAKKLLLNAQQASNDSTEIYRSLARYYQLIGRREKETEALDMALFFFNYRNEDFADTLNLIEEIALSKQRTQFAIKNSSQLFEAGTLLNRLLSGLNIARDRNLDIDQIQLAEAYSMSGDFYYQHTPTSLSALAYYQKAIRLGVQNPYMDYRFGYQLYQQKNFVRAVSHFLQSQRELANNNKIRYALGNSLLQMGSYNSDQGILEETYTSLQEELRQSFLLDPQYSKEARDRLFMLVRLANDLGVSYYREASRSPNSQNESTALAYLMQGMNYLDILSRENTVSLKLPPELLFRPRLLTKKAIARLEDAIPAQGLIPGSLPDRNLKQILSIPAINQNIQPYWMDILDPLNLEETMDY